MSSQIDMDVLVDKAGNGTVIMSWPTKESYVRDQKNVLDPNHPAGICGSLAKTRIQAVKMAEVKPSDLKFTTMASIAPSPQ